MYMYVCIHRMGEQLCERIHELVARVVVSCGLGGDAEGEVLDAVEIVGGGPRVPCIAAAVQVFSSEHRGLVRSIEV